MSWGSVAEFLALGGDGLYVWSAYAAAALAVGLECWLLARRQQRAMRQAVQAHTAGEGA
nr:heme exporter protein CcmD [uncultured Caldimonas sp.]